MSLGGLVSYGSSDEDSDHEEVQEEKLPQKEDNVLRTHGEISDEEDYIPSIIDEKNDEDLEHIPGLSSSKSLFESLPAISSNETETANNFIDENEDLSTIPQAKVYSENPDLKAVKPKKKGPVRIMAPSLVNDADDDVKSRPLVKPDGPSKKSGLLGLLPAPKNSITPSSVPSLSSSSNPKPVGKTTTSFVPRSVSKPASAAGKKSSHNGNDSDNEDSSVPFFTMSHNEKKSDKITLKNPLSSMTLSVKSNPEAAHPRGIEPGSHPSHQFRYDEDLAVATSSSVTAPYPPVQGPSMRPQSSNQEILEQLAGKAGSKRRRAEADGFDQIVDVNFDDIKPDEREWLTKAVTEDDADKPGPKNTIKGERKRKHQITYLAAMAKEREHELKKQWSDSASNRRTAANKYGF